MYDYQIILDLASWSQVCHASQNAETYQFEKRYKRQL